LRKNRLHGEKVAPLPHLTLKLQAMLREMIDFPTPNEKKPKDYLLKLIEERSAS
jgi:hypothetical protein